MDRTLRTVATGHHEPTRAPAGSLAEAPLRVTAEGGSPASGSGPASLAHSPPAVVIGLDCVTGLQTARILAGHRIPVVGVANDPGHPCCRTRVCERIVTADTAGAGLIDVLVRLGPTLGGVAVLVPCTDMSVLLISRHRDALAPWYRMPLPAPEVVELLVDKGRFYRFAQEEGLPLPTTMFLRSPEDAAKAAGVLRFPVVLKPAVKTPEWKRHSRAKAYRVGRPDELMGLYRRYGEFTECLIAQELIEGADTDHYTCNCYFGRDSEPLVTFTTRKLRQWPPFGGEACLGQECRDEVLERETVRLFGSVRHRGFGYLEMKRDVRTGELLIIEPNIGRPTGRSATAEAAGVDLLYTMYCDVLDRPLPENRRQSFREVKWIHLRRDLQASVYHWCRGQLSFAAWLRSMRGPKTEALFSWRDPIPFWADCARVFLELARGRSARRRSEDEG